MATLKTSLWIVLFSISVLAGRGYAASNDLEAPDPAALQAYKQYWDAFAEYESQRQRTSVEEFERARDGIKSAFEQKDRDQTEKRIKLLHDGITRYEKHLETMPSASNRSYVMLNLTQMLSELAALQDTINSATASESRQRALTILKELEEKYPHFNAGNDALYQRVTLLEKNREYDAALVVWRKLAASPRPDRYALHANLAVGDWEFQHASPDKALEKYELASSMLGGLDSQDKGLDELRIQYRIGWAAYKATKHERAIEAARSLMSPGLASKAVRQKDKIVRDAIDLVAFSLYELDNNAKAKETVSKVPFNRHGAAILLVMMTRYAGANQNDRVADLGALATDKFGSSRELPDILLMAANANQALNRPIARINYLEKLAMLLPENSLWRSRFGSDAVLSDNLDDHATQSAITVANWHYENGLASSSAKSFENAAGFFSVLVQKYPAKEDALTWRLRIANCLLYSGQLQKAEEKYTELIAALKVSDDVLSIAMYQKALTVEKIWRQKFEGAIQKGLDPIKDPAALQELARVESIVNDHANKFPNQTRSIDLLLVAASANRDHNRFVEASRFWQRSLLAAPSDAQRAMAVRGLVFAQLRSGKPSDVIEMVRKFLRLETNRTLSQNLAIELKGVLSAAAMDEGQRLAKLGENEAAGNVLIDIAKEFTDIPKREQIYRDGSYMLAIGGNWPSAEESAKAYLSAGLKKFWGDMTYLVARANEFQMRFAPAVKSYIALAENDPTHSRVGVAIERAEGLAVADEDYSSAARALTLKGDKSTDRAERLAAYAKACDYRIKAGTLDLALAVAQKRKSDSRTEDERIDSEILLSKVRYAQGDRQTAVDDMDSLAKQIDRNKFKLGDRYAGLASRANEFLGDDLHDKFSEFRLAEKKDLNRSVEEKSAMFTEMATRYDKVASLDQAEASPRARFLLASSANEFADELSGLPSRTGEPLTLKSQTRFNQNVSRMRDMAKRYHSNNILAKQRAPQFYARSEWVKRSALALSSGGDTVVRDSKEQTTSATHVEVPQQWSL